MVRVHWDPDLEGGQGDEGSVVGSYDGGALRRLKRLVVGAATVADLVVASHQRLGRRYAGGGKVV